MNGIDTYGRLALDIVLLIKKLGEASVLPLDLREKSKTYQKQAHSSLRLHNHLGAISP